MKRYGNVIQTGTLATSEGPDRTLCITASEQGLHCLQKAQQSVQKHAYSNILRILPPKTENFQMKISDIFHISAQNIGCGYSLEPSQ